MKGREIERLARKHLLPVLPGFAARRSLVYRRPFDYFLHGLSFDTSSFTSARIFVTAFIQPLYGPEDEIFLTYGFRLGNDFWDVDEDDPAPTFAQIAERARREALPFFNQVTDLNEFAALVPTWANAQPRKIMQVHTLDDPVVSEDLAYAEVLRGNKDKAARLLQDRSHRNAKTASTPMRSGSCALWRARDVSRRGRAARTDHARERRRDRDVPP